MRILCVFFMLTCVVSCNSKADQTNKDDTSNEKDSQKITPKDIEKLEFTDYVLSPDSKKAVGNWQNYQELMMQIDFLKQGDLSFFDGENELLFNFVKDLKTTIPKNIATPSITARLSAMETKLLKLHSTLQLDYFQKQDVLKDVKELLVSVSNMHLQMNKKFELESQVIETPY